MIMSVYDIASYMGFGEMSAVSHLKCSYSLLGSYLIPFLFFRGLRAR